MTKAEFIREFQDRTGREVLYICKIKDSQTNNNLLCLNCSSLGSSSFQAYYSICSGVSIRFVITTASFYSRTHLEKAIKAVGGDLHV